MLELNITRVPIHTAVRDASTWWQRLAVLFINVYSAGPGHSSSSSKRLLAGVIECVMRLILNFKLLAYAYVMISLPRYLLGVPVSCTALIIA
jgi:hypothetical protein